MSHDDFAFEPVRGLPETLPPGETILWQGAPDWRALAKSLFHIRWIAAYFALMIGWQIVTAAYDRQPLTEAAIAVLWMSLLAGLGCAILAFLAWAIARTTVYTITNERLVMRIGVALPVTLNIPFAKVKSAAAAVGANGFGNISLVLNDDEKIAYAMLWPHARPWRMKRAEPTLRSIPDAQRVVQELARALAISASRPDARSTDRPSADIKPFRPAAPSAPEADRQGSQVARSA